MMRLGDLPRGLANPLERTTSLDVFEERTCLNKKRIGIFCNKSGLNTKATEGLFAATVTSRTPLLLVSGWECQDRRLCRGRRSLGMLPRPFLYWRKGHTPGPGRGARERRTPGSLQHRDGPQSSGTRPPPPCHPAPSSKLVRAGMPGTEDYPRDCSKVRMGRRSATGLRRVPGFLA